MEEQQLGISHPGIGYNDSLFFERQVGYKSSKLAPLARR
jgi:hypothetical protein